MLYQQESGEAERVELKQLREVLQDGFPNISAATASVAPSRLWTWHTVMAPATAITSIPIPNARDTKSWSIFVVDQSAVSHATSVKSQLSRRPQCTSSVETPLCQAAADLVGMGPLSPGLRGGMGSGMRPGKSDPYAPGALVSGTCATIG